jgi:hypothetical protein
MRTAPSRRARRSNARKLLTTLEAKRETAGAIAGALERIGGRAASYADNCRARETDELLCAWPPDTELLSGCSNSRPTGSRSPQLAPSRFRCIVITF